MAAITRISSLLAELHFTLPKPPLVWSANLTILLSANPIQHVRTKHVEFDLNLLEKRYSRAVLLSNTFRLLIKLHFLSLKSFQASDLCFASQTQS